KGIRVNPHSSLAVFYVEQVALNRHVLFWSDRENRLGCNRVNNFMKKFLQPSWQVFERQKRVRASESIYDLPGWPDRWVSSIRGPYIMCLAVVGGYWHHLSVNDAL